MSMGESEMLMGEEVKGMGESRLSNNEAILYQTYATKKEEIGFSEQAGAESYAEAERILTEIRRKGVSIDSIDWSAIKTDEGFGVFANSLKETLAASGYDTTPIHEQIRKLQVAHDGSAFQRNVLSLLSAALLVVSVTAEAGGRIEVSPDGSRIIGTITQPLGSMAPDNLMENREVHNHSQMVSGWELSLFQKVAPEYGVTITVLKKAGETYSHYEGSMNVLSTGKVKDGQAYVNISSPKRDLTDFFEAVNRLKTEEGI